jgi:tetratricopeptide (TPR) repeat protein
VLRKYISKKLLIFVAIFVALSLIAVGIYSYNIISEKSQISVAEKHCEEGCKWLEKDKWDRAIKEFTEAIRIASDFYNAYQYRASACLKKGDYDSAIADYSEMIRLRPIKPDAYYLRAFVFHFIRNDYNRAIQDYNQCIKQDPKNAKYYYARGEAYDSRGDKKKAAEDFVRAKSLEPVVKP